MEKVIAIDFDGCLCENAWPEIGQPHWAVIHKALEERENRAKLILWTCREGALLDSAVAACRAWGLEFDAVNASLESWVVRFGNDSRKVGATEYWDDRAVRMDGGYAYKARDTGSCGERGITRQRLTGMRDARNERALFSGDGKREAEK